MSAEIATAEESLITFNLFRWGETNQPIAQIERYEWMLCIYSFLPHRFRFKQQKCAFNTTFIYIWHSDWNTSRRENVVDVITTIISNLSVISRFHNQHQSTVSSSRTQTNLHKSKVTVCDQCEASTTGQKSATGNCPLQSKEFYFWLTVTSLSIFISLKSAQSKLKDKFNEE